MPRFWDAIRHTVDRRDADGQFILTGSAVPPATDEIEHTGTGRIARLHMRPMSLWESQDSTGTVSLSHLFRPDAVVDGTSPLTLSDIAFLTCRGGWPRAVDKKSRAAALLLAEEYIDAIAESDISRVDAVRRDADNDATPPPLLRPSPGESGQHRHHTAGYGAERAGEPPGISTIESYLRALRRIFVIEDAPAWNPNLRSKTAIRTSDTRYFSDPSIATAAMGIAPDDLINDPETFGLLFETLCLRDLRIYADSLGGRVYHYRDKNGLECDAVVHLRNGSYGLIEIKLGGDTGIAEGVKTLTTLANRIDTTRMKAPTFKAILTAVGGYAYRRQDGIYILPIGSLKD